jgi:hypothetical protein
LTSGLTPTPTSTSTPTNLKYTIQSSRNKNDTAWGDGKSYLSVYIKDNVSTNIYVESTFTDTSCQWRVVPVTGKTDTYTIQNIRNSSKTSYSRGYSYLSVNPTDNNDKKVTLWNRPGDPICQWIMKPALDSTNKAIQYTYTLQSVHRVTTNKKISYILLNTNNSKSQYIKYNTVVYLGGDPKESASHFIMSTI